MKKGFRKVAAYILAFAMLFAYMPMMGSATVYADDGELPALENVLVEDGYVSWNAYQGGEFDHYLVSVVNPQESDNSFGEWVDKEASDYQLDRWIDKLITNNELTKNEDGVYTVTVSACDEGGTALAESSVPYSYDSPAVPVEVSTITGLDFDQNARVLSWDAYYEDPNGHALCDYAYTIQYDADHSESWFIEEPQVDLTDALEYLRENGKIKKGDEVTIYVTAYTRVDLDDTESDRIAIGQTDESNYIKYTYEPYELGELDVSISDGELTWSEFAGAETYKVVIGDPEYGHEEEFSYSDQPVDLNLMLDRASIWGWAAPEDGNLWRVTVYAMGEDLDGEGGEVLAEWPGKYEYEAKTVQPLQASISKDGYLSWEDVAGADHYNVWVTTRNGGLSAEPTTWSNGGEGVSLNINDIIDDQLRNGTLENYGTYYIRLAAMDERDDELAIAEWEYNYKYKSDAVPLVREIKNFRVADNALQWDAVEGAETYKVTYWEPFAEAEPDDWERPETVTLTEPSFDISSVLNGDPDETSYRQFIVYAYNEKGEKIGRGETEYRYPEGDAIQTIELTDITSSIAKGGPVVFSEEPAVSDESKMFIQSEKWTNIADEDDFFMGFEEADDVSIPTPGSTYRYSIQLSAEEGYHFTKDMTVTCNGKTYTADKLKIELINCGMTVQISGLLDDTEIEATQISEDNVIISYGEPGTSRYRGDLADKTLIYSDASNGNMYLAGWVGVFLKGDEPLMLENGTDYTVVYDLESAQPTATFTFTGQYTGTIVVPMQAAKVTVSVPVVKLHTIGSGDTTYGETVTATHNGVKKVLTYGKDYKAGYMMGASQIGDGYILGITGLGDYVGWIEGYTYKVVGDLAETKVSTTKVTVPSATYTGKTITPKPVVKFTAFNETKTLKKGTDYTVTIKNSSGKTVTSPVTAGTYKVTVKGKGNYTGTKTQTFKINKAANTMKVSGKTATVKASKVKKANQTVTKANAFTIKNAKGKVTFTKSSGSSKITVSSAGKITVKKGLKAGTYKVKVKVKAAGNSNYKVLTKTVTVTIKVK